MYLYTPGKLPLTDYTGLQVVPSSTGSHLGSPTRRSSRHFLTTDSLCDEAYHVKVMEQAKH